jgi:hypothetical protein
MARACSTLRDGRLRVQDGPSAGTKEQIGGTFVIDVPDLDAALARAEKHPTAQCGPRRRVQLPKPRASPIARPVPRYEVINGGPHSHPEGCGSSRRSCASGAGVTGTVATTFPARPAPPTK